MDFTMTYKQILTTFRVIMAVITGIVTLIMVFFLDVTLIIHLKDDLGLNETQGGYFFASNALLFTFTSPVIGYITQKRYIQTRYITMTSLIVGIIGLLLLGPSYLLPISVKSIISPFIGMTIYGFVISLGFVPLLSELIEAVEEKMGIKDHEQISDKCSAVYNCTWAFGSIIAPIIGGVMADNLTFQETCDILAFIAAIYTAFYIIVNILGAAILCKKKKIEEVVEKREQISTGLL